jgi:signal transduction histidine kinase
MILFLFKFFAFLNGIAALIFGFAGFIKNPKAVINKIFFLMNLSVVLWSFSYLFWISSNSLDYILFWVKSLSIAATFIPIFFLHWIIDLLKIKKGKKIILGIGYALTLIFTILHFSPFLIKKGGPILIFSYWPKGEALYLLYVLILYILVPGFGVFLLLKKYKAADAILKAQIKFVSLGSIIAFAGGITNFFLWFGIKIFPLGNFLVWIYVALFSYAMLRYHLMNIKVIITEFMTGLVWLVLLIQLFLSEGLNQILINLSVLTVLIILGIILIKSVLKEVQTREEIEKLAEKLEAANERLKRLDEEKSEFLSIASHQLRTPMTIIKGYVSMIMEGSFGKFSQKLKNVLTKVYISNERLIKLINDLLDISRIERGKMEYNFKIQSLEKLALDVIRELKSAANKKNIQLIWISPEKALPKAAFDEDYIRQVIVNLIDNAIKYTLKGKIEVGVKKQLKTGKLKVVLFVKDTGAGISKEMIPHLFQRYSRGEKAYSKFAEGMGLGLYVAKKIIDDHGGKIWAESEGKGKGSVFYVELPAVP